MKLVIGGHDYTVVEMREQTRDGKDLLGLHDPKTNTITLDADMADTRKHETLLHEIVHVILTNAGVMEHDEQLIDAISNGLLQLGIGSYVWQKAKKA